MSATILAPSTLPGLIPIFPLPGVVLLPRARLPLHIFEPRYLAMLDDVLASPGRLIGMVQPMAADDKTDAPPAIYTVGCAGRVTSFAETEDGRMMVSLTGISRFEIVEELKTDLPYRQVRPDWKRFSDDTVTPEASIDHVQLLLALKPYFKAQSIEADWAAIESMQDEILVSTLAMICPFAPNEKQALLEAPDLPARAAMMMALLEMATMPPGEGNAKH